MGEAARGASGGFAQHGDCGVQPRLQSAERNLEQSSRLLVRMTLQEGEGDCVALASWKSAQRNSDLRRVKPGQGERGYVVFDSFAAIEGALFSLEAPLGVTDAVYGPVVRHHGQPSEHRSARGIVRARSLPDSEVDLLNDLGGVLW